MIVTCVHIAVKEEYIQEFIQATINNHNESIKESGNLRFDILQQSEDPSLFTLYEAYQTEDDVAKHKLTPHYHIWKDKVDIMMKQARKGVKHSVIMPNEIKKWK